MKVRKNPHRFCFNLISFILSSSEEPQKLIPSELGVTVKNFGVSISGLRDIDDNRFNDVAIGATDPGKAVILRGLEVVRITPRWFRPGIPGKAVNPKTKSNAIH